MRPHRPERRLPLLNKADRQRDGGRRNTAGTDGFELVMAVTRRPRELGAECTRQSARGRLLSSVSAAVQKAAEGEPCTLLSPR